MRGLTVRHWAALVSRVKDALGQLSWNRCTGPATGTIATLLQYGWQPVTAINWIDSSDTSWEFDINLPRQLYKPVLTSMEDTVLRHIWSSASNHFCGKGLHEGVEWFGTLALRKQLVRSQSDAYVDIPELLAAEEEQWPANAAAWLDLALTGGYWPRHRTFYEMKKGTPNCPRCGRSEETPFHLLWECEANLGLTSVHIERSQYLVSQARSGHLDIPCFWLRGLMPITLVPCNTPMVTNDEYHVMGEHGFHWPPGAYFTDASGGKHTAIPILRRCGIGIAFLADDLSTLRFGLFAPLPGATQTVPRGELYAILVVMRHTQPDSEYLIYSDSKLNVDLYLDGYDACMKSQNADLWEEVFDILRTRNVVLSLVWIKAHVDTPEEATRHNLSYMHILGNEFADRLAERAATAYEVAYQDSVDLLWYYATLRKIQARLLVILASIIPERSAVPESIPRAPRERPTPLGCAIFNSKHSLFNLGRSMHCCVCFQQAPRDRVPLMQWLAAPCKPDRAYAYLQLTSQQRPVSLPQDRPMVVGRRAAHPSHSLMAYKGLIFCSRCGYYGHKRYLRLAYECTGMSSDEAISRVRNLRAGNLPSGVPNWPNSDTYRQIRLL